MEQPYRDAIDNASAELSQALLSDIPTLLEQGHRLDALVREIMRSVALALLSALYQGLCLYFVQCGIARGLVVQSRPKVWFKTLFGALEIESPYLRHPDSGESARPMKDILGVEGNYYSETAKRALVDFGAEKSFARAALSFNEHYGWQVGRTTLRHLTLEAAQDAETYLDLRLEEATQTYGRPSPARPGVDTMLMELDGCEIRTGVYMTAAEAGVSDKPPGQGVRVENWRDVRTGLARPLAARERLYVCRLDSYSEVLDQLFGVACAQGLQPWSQVVVPGDGAKGLREAVLQTFAGAQYILDRPHLQSHFYDTATALGLEDTERHQWVAGYMQQCWAGEVHEVCASLQQRYEAAPNERLRRLIDHVTRFQDSVDYGTYHEHGWPLGSGEVESAHRYVPQERLKIAGACWNPDNVNPMLALRVVRANNWWEAFWQWRFDQRQVQTRV